MPVTESPFMQAYLDGVTQPLTPAVFDGALEGGPGVAAEDLEAPRAETVESFALGGQILTAEGPMRGWITIEGGVITALSTRKPRGPRTLATDGVIVPGLIDLHGHPEFNVFAPWEPPKHYINRYSWRASDAYQTLIREPEDQLVTQLPPGTQLRYAEIRAVVGGTTAIQGAGQRTQGKTESLVRNVDGVIFGEHRARSMIDPLSARGDDLENIVEAIGNHEVDAFYAHLAEGRHDNARSQEEFDKLADLGGITEATVLIHGTAMTRDQLGSAKDAGAKLVWSPQSNLRLYGETTRAADAIDVGLPMALGADWLPSGSTSLLAEMKVARQELENQGLTIEPGDLVAMVTAGAAAIAGLDDHLGTLAVGRVADLVVFARTDADLYESVCDATPNDVELVLIGGDLVYGRSDWVSHLAADPADPILEPVLAWGRSMLLDTSYEGHADGDPTPRLEQLRADLTSTYPPVGPIWA